MIDESIINCVSLSSLGKVVSRCAIDFFMNEKLAAVMRIKSHNKSVARSK